MTEDEMVGWHHRLNGYEFEQALGVGDRQGSLVCCSPWGCRDLDTTKRPSLSLSNDNDGGKKAASSYIRRVAIETIRLTQILNVH